MQVRGSDGGSERLAARHFISAVDAPVFHKLAATLFPSTRGMAGVSRGRRPSLWRGSGSTGPSTSPRCPGTLSAHPCCTPCFTSVPSNRTWPGAAM